MMLMGRHRRIVLGGIGVGIVVFVAVSFFLARVFAANGAEQSAITDLVRAEAAGNQTAVMSRIYGCSRSASCRERVAQDVAVLRRPGKVSIVQLQPSTSFSIGGMVGTARVAWIAGSSLPIVQCVRVRRAGNLFGGLKVQLLELSVRIKSDTACPARY
jgi:hypothetical protein